MYLGYRTLLLHLPDDFIDFTLNCPPTFYNTIASMSESHICDKLQ